MLMLTNPVKQTTSDYDILTEPVIAPLRQIPEPSRSYARPLFENLHNNPGAEILKYANACKQEGRTMIPLGQGESDLPTPDFITGAAQQAMGRGKTFYSPILGQPELRTGLSDYYRRIYGLDVPSDRIAVTMSGTAAINIALQAIVEQGDEVVAVTPIWKNLLGAIELRQGSVREVRLDEQDGAWSLDLEKLFGAVTDKTRALIINAPNNPTGWVINRTEMQDILDFARRKGLWIISDEVYSRLIYGADRAPSFLDISAPDDRLFVVNSFSKNWAMTGWRMGWLVFPPQAHDVIYDTILYDNMGAPSFTQFGALAALEEGESFLAAQKAWHERAMTLVHDMYDDLGNIIAAPPKSTFYSFFKIRGQDDCMTLARRLIDEAGVTLAPGCSFSKTTNGYMRLCFAISEPLLRTALERMHPVLKSYKRDS